MQNDDDMSSASLSLNPIDSMASKMLREDLMRAANLAVSLSEFVAPSGLICGAKIHNFDYPNEPCSDLDRVHELVTEGPCLESPTVDGYSLSSPEDKENSHVGSDHASIITKVTSNMDTACTPKNNIEVSYDYDKGAKAILVSYGTSSGTTVNEYRAKARRFKVKPSGGLYTKGSLLNQGSKRFGHI